MLVKEFWWQDVSKQSWLGRLYWREPTSVFLFFPGPFEVYDVAPWTNTHLQMRKFSDRLKDLEELVYLYPQIDKNDAFGQYYTNDGKDPPVYSAHNPTI